MRFRHVLRRLLRMPMFTSVAVATLAIGIGANAAIASDKNYEQTQLPPIRSFKFISPGPLKTMGNTLVAGREFTWADAYDTRPVAMVSENLARELWGQPSAAIGKRIRENNSSAWREVVGVVGVVGDERDDGVDKKAPTVAYWPMLMSNLEGGDEFSVRRTTSYMVRSPRAGSTALTAEVSRGSGR